MTKLAIFGATGRMGLSLVRGIREASDLTLAGALVEPGNAALGQDIGRVGGQAEAAGVLVTDDHDRALAGADVAIDFTLPVALRGNLAACVRRRVALVIGTTGLKAADQTAIDEAAGSIAVLQATNMSLGVNLLLQLVRQAAAALPDSYDIEIVEAHHRHKLDAPSGTALSLGEAAALGRGTTLGEAAVPTHISGAEARARGKIGFAVLRGGDVIGDHEVLFLGPGEAVKLGHHASDRMTFAYGALAAARWLQGRPPGRYSMRDVLGLQTT